ncbi:carbohydrate ABC transporter permease [Blautia producta]|uniref:L-arabinose transport system permease protein AraQ n=1 Tax=Blautia producta TaxID=33035 RepID=A0A4P6LZL4_9FIRM|nr:carbohydrate ABC transporter permease [Blautia producta]QBE97699.1 L-arabinose transport system permease protein AraQ [Blautia producta]
MTKKKINAAIMLIFILLSVIVLFPILCLVIGALKPSSEIIRSGLNARIDLDIMGFSNFKSLFTSGTEYFIWFKNSFLLTIVQTMLSLFVSASVAYGFAMYEFKMKKVWFSCMLLIMMIPMEIIMLPLYKEMITFQLIDKFAGVLLPFIAAPIPIFFFHQFLKGISPAFLDAARVDGCTEIGIFVKIILPLMAPAFASMGIYQGMVSWNNFLWPLIVLKSNSKMTLPIGLSTLMTPYGNNYDILLAGSVMAIIPVLILFLAFQKYFIAGMTAGGVKG